MTRKGKRERMGDMKTAEDAYRSGGKFYLSLSPGIAAKALYEIRSKPFNASLPVYGNLLLAGRIGGPSEVIRMDEEVEICE